MAQNQMTPPADVVERNLALLSPLHLGGKTAVCRKAGWGLEYGVANFPDSLFAYQANASWRIGANFPRNNPPHRGRSLSESYHR